MPLILGLSQRHSAQTLAAVITFVAFVIGAGLGGDAADRTLLPVVRFLALAVGAAGLAMAIAASLYIVRSRLRWSLGQASAAGIALGGGLLWSGAAFGAGFGCLVKVTSQMTA